MHITTDPSDPKYDPFYQQYVEESKKKIKTIDIMTSIRKNYNNIPKKLNIVKNKSNFLK